MGPPHLLSMPYEPIIISFFSFKVHVDTFLKRYFPSGPVAKILCSHSRGPGFDPWSGNYTLHASGKCSHAPTKSPEYHS